MIVLLCVTMLFAGLALLHLRGAVLLFLFLFHAFPEAMAFGVGGEGFALTLQRLSLYALLIAWTVRVLLHSPDTMRGIRILRSGRTVSLPLTALMGVAFVSTLIGSGFGIGAVSGFANLLLFSLFPLLLIVTTVRNEGDVVTVFLVLAAAAAFNEAFAFVEHALGRSPLHGVVDVAYRTHRDLDQLAGRFRGGEYRVMGSFTNPLKLVAFLCLSCPPLLFLAGERKGGLTTILIGGTLVLLVPVLLWTQSRTGLALLVAALWAWMVFRPRTGAAQRSRAAVFLASTSALALLVMVFRTTLLRRAVLDAEAMQSFFMRLQQLTDGLGLLAGASPLGYGMSRNILDVVQLGSLDNCYLRVGLETGAVGLMLYVLYWTGAWRLTGRIVKRAETLSGKRLAFALRLSLAIGLLLQIAVSQLSSYLLLHALVGCALVLESSARKSAG
ncbi:MAG: hypothetical protein QF819_06650 [Gemmatimonadota bacterium]|jgi:hypothetical protein|nr:hypothetical protein [Gemmatimonadota bacterium]MDP6802838.1 hypothetical protein [Gemmatimonadota bacterium]MDP7031051.1 hypothetical protein [Gemmatimonadota bacterium]